MILRKHSLTKTQLHVICMDIAVKMLYQLIEQTEFSEQKKLSSLLKEELEDFLEKTLNIQLSDE